MNTEKLKRLRVQLIKAHEKNALDMRSWGVRKMDSLNIVHPEPGECGTALCAAGWAVVLGGWRINWLPRERTAERCSKDNRSGFIEVIGMEELEMTYPESQILFYSTGQEDDEDIETTEVIRVLDAMILWSELRPNDKLEDQATTENEARRFLIDWYDMQPTAA